MPINKFKNFRFINDQKMTSVKARFGKFIECSLGRNNVISPNLPINSDTLIFVAVSYYLHYNELCWIGFCTDHHDHHQFNQHKISLASFMFFLATSIFSSQFSWWPEHINITSCTAFKFLYKVRHYDSLSTVAYI